MHCNISAVDFIYRLYIILNPYSRLFLFLCARCSEHTGVNLAVVRAGNLFGDFETEFGVKCDCAGIGGHPAR